MNDFKTALESFMAYVNNEYGNLPSYTAWVNRMETAFTEGAIWAQGGLSEKDEELARLKEELEGLKWAFDERGVAMQEIGATIRSLYAAEIAQKDKDIAHLSELVRNQK